LKLCPGGHLGRFCIWSQGAFEKLDSVFAEKNNYNVPKAKMTNADLTRLINSEEIQKAIRPAKPVPRRATIKKNPLKNVGVMLRLNPHAKSLKRNAILAKSRKEAKDKQVAQKRGMTQQKQQKKK